MNAPWTLAVRGGELYLSIGASTRRLLRKDALRIAVRLLQWAVP